MPGCPRPGPGPGVPAHTSTSCWPAEHVPHRGGHLVAEQGRGHEVRRRPVEDPVVPEHRVLAAGDPDVADLGRPPQVLGHRGGALRAGDPVPVAVHDEHPPAGQVPPAVVGVDPRAPAPRRCARRAGPRTGSPRARRASARPGRPVRRPRTARGPRRAPTPRRRPGCGPRSQPREEFSSRCTASRPRPARAIRRATGTIRSTESWVGLTTVALGPARRRRAAPAPRRRGGPAPSCRSGGRGSSCLQCPGPPKPSVSAGSGADPEGLAGPGRCARHESYRSDRVRRPREPAGPGRARSRTPAPARCGSGCTRPP